MMVIVLQFFSYLLSVHKYHQFQQFHLQMILVWFLQKEIMVAAAAMMEGPQLRDWPLWVLSLRNHDGRRKQQQWHNIPNFSAITNPGVYRAVWIEYACKLAHRQQRPGAASQYRFKWLAINFQRSGHYDGSVHRHERYFWPSAVIPFEPEVKKTIKPRTPNW